MVKFSNDLIEEIHKHVHDLALSSVKQAISGKFRAGDYLQHIEDGIKDEVDATTHKIVTAVQEFLKPPEQVKKPKGSEQA
ncbi:MAG: hypothetical protein KGN01_06965 [Patescibacteria group bacterium]|nr:hypothetical protein [Patescibacteria group bacterium]